VQETAPAAAFDDAAVLLGQRTRCVIGECGAKRRVAGVFALGEKGAAPVCQIDRDERRLAGRAHAPQRRKQIVLSSERLDEDLHFAAAGKADLPRLLVRDADLEQPGRRALEDCPRLGDHRGFDAPS